LKKWVPTIKYVCYGGHSIDTEIKNLSNPPAVLIGTQDVLDHIDRGTFDKKLNLDFG
jgi:superfamily II DNA/RNA helicase